MKNLLFLFLLVFQFSNAQNEDLKLEFNSNYYDAVNKWIAFPANDDDKGYSFGFIYIDEMAGFTYNYENNFKIENNTLVLDSIIDKRLTNIKHRLGQNTKKIAILSGDQLKQLNLDNKPKWLEIYTKNENKVSYLTKIGYHYNHVGASNNALKPLLLAYSMNPAFKNLAFELGFAYNATQQFDNAIPIIKFGLKNEPKNQYLHKELGFAYLGASNVVEAEIAYLKGFRVSKDDAIKCEMAVNMSNAFLVTKNKVKLTKWIGLIEETINAAPQFKRYLEYYKAENAKL